MTPQNANHYSLAEVQMNKLQTLAYNKWEFMQQFYSVIQYSAIILSDYAYKLQFVNSARWQDILTSSRIIVQIYVISIWLWN